MSYARPIRKTTLQFLLTDTGGLDKDDVFLTVIAAIVADGSYKACKDVLVFALESKVSAHDLREAILHVSAFVGPFRSMMGLEALAKAGSEVAKPTDAFSAIMGNSGGGKVDPASQNDVDKEDASHDQKRRQRAAELFEKVHGDNASQTAQKLGQHSATLQRWITDEVHGKVFGRPRLSFQSRLLISVGALFTQNMRTPLQHFVKAASDKGLTKDQLWNLHGLLKRLFNEGPHQDGAEKAFTNALGAKKGDGLGPGRDPFRWD